MAHDPTPIYSETLLDHLDALGDGITEDDPALVLLAEMDRDTAPGRLTRATAEGLA